MGFGLHDRRGRAADVTTSTAGPTPASLALLSGRSVVLRLVKAAMTSHDETPAVVRPPGGAVFATTAWSQVLKAGSVERPEGRVALAELCRAYWYPLFAYHRRRGAAREEAEDAVQAFFARLIEHNLVRLAVPERGRFRGFLIAAFRQFLAARHEREAAAKRRPAGGLVSIDTSDGEARFARELADRETPERLYERAWAMELIGRALDRLRAEYEGLHGADRFRVFDGVLTGQSDRSAREIGEALGMTEGAARVALHRLRKRYAALLREEVGATIGDDQDADDEIRLLLAVLRPS
jgi:RNA polymerase sigma factor (sigma-70 family)